MQLQSHPALHGRPVHGRSGSAFQIFNLNGVSGQDQPRVLAGNPIAINLNRALRAATDQVFSIAQMILAHQDALRVNNGNLGGGRRHESAFCRTSSPEAN